MYLARSTFQQKLLKKTQLTWTLEMSNAFNNAKRALANATLLAHPRCDAPISLTSDASDRGVGDVLVQFDDGRWQPIAFFSKQLRNPELM